MDKAGLAVVTNKRRAGDEKKMKRAEKEPQEKEREKNIPSLPWAPQQSAEIDLLGAQSRS